MDMETVNDIALRLLELEQRFESYCALHEEELREIKAILDQLRKDTLMLHREQVSDQSAKELISDLDDDASRDDASEDFPVLTL